MHLLLLVIVAMVISPPVFSQAIKYGVNGHDGRPEYPLYLAERRMALLSAQNLTTYRFDVSTSSVDILDTLVPLAQKYGIKLRPMLYPGTQAASYGLAKRYARDIKVWEIGNEQDAPREGAQSRINAMMQSYHGIIRASTELNAGLQTSINIMACNPNGVSQCQGDSNGDVWFLDMAKKSGFNFNYVTFHYYPRISEKGYWMDLYLGQMRTAATRYGVPIFYNEVNCGEIYDRNTRGDGACHAALDQILAEIRDKYSDIVREVNIYELLDEAASMVGIEGHFGIMHSLDLPKPTAKLLTTYANATRQK
jgi:hypothetical protein